MFYSKKKLFLFHLALHLRLLLHMKEKWIKAITRIINIQQVGFSYSLLFTKIQKLKGWYYTNQILWIEVVSEWWGIFKGTSIKGSWSSTDSFPSISLHPRLGFNPSSPGAGLLSPPAPRPLEWRNFQLGLGYL